MEFQYLLAGFELDRNAPERRSGSFFENSERKSDDCCCVHTSVLRSVAVLKLRLGIEIAINDTSACLLIYYILGHFIQH